MNFMKLPAEYSDEESKVVILPIAYEKNLTFGVGASRGPDAIISASQHLEYYDSELDSEPFEQGIHTATSLRCSNLEPEAAQEAIYQLAKKYTNKFIVGIGGDHSVTGGFIRALAEKHDKISLLVIDAHADLRYSWNGSQWNHACIMRRLAPNHKLSIVGVRALDKSEKEYADTQPNIMIVGPRELNTKKVEDILAHLDENVFISIDVDGFDPTLIRSTGTPEPGGLEWYPVLDLIKKTFENKNVVGCDVVEFAPEDNGSRAEAFILAKLIYKMIGYKLVGI